MTTTSEYSSLQSQCQQILNELRVPQPYALDATLRWMEGLRQRPLILKELPPDAAGAGACGLWLSTDEADFVFYEGQTAPLHQEHIILHEVGHMLSDHHGGGDSGIDDTLQSLLTGLQPHLIRRLMARTHYTTAEERKAEMLASLIHSCGRPPRPVGAPGRLGAFLGVRADDRR